MMADMSQYYDALRNADAAGDHESAQKLADYIHSQESAQAPTGAQQPQAAVPTAPKTASERAKEAIVNLRSENPLDKMDAMNKTSPAPTLRSATNAIASSTALGGIAGALSPEILQGLGVAAMAIPVVGEAVGPALVATGTALKATRLASAAYGALGGATSEAAGQAVEAAGGTRGQAEAARLAGGLIPGAAGSIASTVSHLVPGPLKVVWGAVQKVAGMSPDATVAVKTAKENLAALADAGQPQTAVHAMLQRGVEADRQASEKAANAVMEAAHADAARLAKTDADTAGRLVDEARDRAAQIRSEAAQRAATLDKASGGKLATANRVLAQAQPELAKVGNVSELSDIGNNIRNAATANQSAELTARNTAYRTAVAERDAAVQSKEAAGQSVDTTPSMVALKKELDTKLSGSKGFARVTDAGVRRGYQQVQDAITRKEVTTGVDANGNPITEKFKTSFEALDHVRRRLGDVVAGREVEGYDAIGKQAAQKMYAQISKAQEEFVGKSADGRNIQRELQQNYAEGSEGLQKFGSKAGKKLTAVDRIDPERFSGDPKTLPKFFFSSQQGVRDLKELTGNPQLVERQAADYAARSLQGMSAKQASAWVRDNNDWIREIPGLPQRASAYASKLEQIERVNSKLTRRAESAATEATAVRGEAAKAAERERQAGIERAGKAAEGSVAAQQRVVEEGAKKAEATRAETFAPSRTLEGILKGGEAPEAVRNLLLTGKPEQTRLAAAHLANDPKGRQVLDQSVRQVMRDMNESTLRKSWSERIHPMLKEGKMLSPEALSMLEKDVKRILDSYAGKDRTAMLRRYIAGALGSAPAVAAGNVRQ